MHPRRNSQSIQTEGKKKREARREEILNTAIDMFYKDGYHKASLRDISEKMGLTQAAIYYHFSSKEEILFTIVDQATKELLFVLKSSISKDRDSVENLHNLILNQILYLETNMKKVKIMVQDRRFLNSKLSAIIKDQERTTFYLFKTYIEKMQNEGKLKKFDLNIVAFGIFAMINWLDYWYKPNKRFTLTQIATEIVEILFKGLLVEEAKNSL